MTLRPTFSIAALVAFNLLPLVGVLVWDWSLFAVLLLYWIESGVIGFFNLFKIAMARAPFSDGVKINGNSPGQHGKLFVLFFFPFHYGIFWVVHGVFVFAFFGTSFFIDANSEMPGGFATIDVTGISIAVVAMLLSHSFSFVGDFVGNKEYLEVSPDQQMMMPYSRVFVMHATILGGGWLITSFGTPLAALALLVVLKLAIDIRGHLREHSPTRQREGVAASAQGVTDRQRTA